MSFKPNLLDRMIGSIAPGYALRRVHARGNLNQLAKRYEGATKTHRGSKWRKLSMNSHGDTIALRDLHVLRERSRAFSRDNGWAVAAEDAVVTHTIGIGIMPSVIAVGGFELDSETKQIFEAKLHAIFSSKLLDNEGELSFYAMQEVILGTVFRDGEVFVRRIWTADSRFPLSLEILEADYLDTRRDSVGHRKAGENYVKGGIEFNPNGRRVAYWFRSTHPGDQSQISTGKDSIRVDAKDVLHIAGVSRRRPRQKFCVPWLSPVLLTLGDFDDFEDGVLVRQKIANAFVGVIEKTGDELQGSLDDESETETGDRTDPIMPGTWQELEPGESMNFSNPPEAPDFPSFSRQLLLKIAKAAGITYEALTGDLSTANYSSGRLGRIAMDSNVRRWQARIMIEQFLAPVGKWIFEAMALTENRNLYPVATTSLTWTPPPRVIVDPAKELPAMIRRIRAGLLPLRQAIIESGGNPDLVLQSYAETNAKIDELGLVLDSDPRKVAQSGVSAGIDEPDSGDGDDPEDGSKPSSQSDE